MNIRVGRAKLYINKSDTGFDNAAAGPLEDTLQINVYQSALSGLTYAALFLTTTAALYF